ncbi:hypothetical protein NBRC116494_18280 [Aurantivibrio plasticivorans]
MPLLNAAKAIRNLELFLFGCNKALICEALQNRVEEQQPVLAVFPNLNAIARKSRMDPFDV